MFIAGIGAYFEFDLKRIIAFSTLRHLGLTIIIISIGLSSLALPHLLTHVLLKALLFMCAGGVFHSVGDSQDIQFTGGLPGYIPFTLCNGPTNALVCNKTLIQTSHIKTLKITPNMFRSSVDHHQGAF
jgi:NADH-ubiquinone oxidoreductase chain 5